MENKNIYILRECTDFDVIYGVIMLDVKHDIKDFQQAIYDTKNGFYGSGFDSWCIEDVFEELYKNFDFEYIAFDNINKNGLEI